MTTNGSALIVPPPGRPNSAALTNDIRDIKAPVAIPNELAWLWWTIAAVLLLSALAGWWLWRRKKKVVLLPVPSVPPHVRARNRLAGALALLQDPKLFCSLVADTTRTYLEERFNFHAPERTTEEFMSELQTTMLLNTEQKQRLAEFLERCDLVKFARLEPTETELRSLLDAALRLVEETRPEAGLSIPAPSLTPSPTSIRRPLPPPPPPASGPRRPPPPPPPPKTSAPTSP